MIICKKETKITQKLPLQWKELFNILADKPVLICSVCSTPLINMDTVLMPGMYN